MIKFSILPFAYARTSSVTDRQTYRISFMAN